MSKADREQDREARWPTGEGAFRCGHCGRLVEPPLWGGKHRNHCPYCLHSRHVDDRTSGDRASACGGLMEPIGAFTRRTGEHVIVHRCLGCRFERFNRIAADDNFGLVRSLPTVEARTAGGSEGASGP